MEYAEKYATPTEARLGAPFKRLNDFGEEFYLRWGKIRFTVHWGPELNVKVLLKVYRSDGIVEHFVVDTEQRQASWNSHRRSTRDFYIHPFPRNCGRVTAVKFAYIVHLGEKSIPSQHEYLFMDGAHFDVDKYQGRSITAEFSTPNTWRSFEVDAEFLQRDVEWMDERFDSLNLVPKFTKGRALASLITPSAISTTRSTPRSAPSSARPSAW